MNDFQGGPDQYHYDPGDRNPPHHKKPNALLEMLMGIGISAVTYVLLWFASTGRYPVAVKALADIVILAAFIFLTVKLLRNVHKIAAVTMLALISPGIFWMMLFGACRYMNSVW